MPLFVDPVGVGVGVWSGREVKGRTVYGCSQYPMLLVEFGFSSLTEIKKDVNQCSNQELYDLRLIDGR